MFICVETRAKDSLENMGASAAHFLWAVLQHNVLRKASVDRFDTNDLY
jgi:hypothetical protein